MTEALPPAEDFDLAGATRVLIRSVVAQGFVFQPWQIATYITAVRTKPFVILAGVTGTGKSKLPALVATATGGESRLVPVRPDWTDSADVLGYVDLQGVFRPGAVLEVLHEAGEQADQFWTCIIDEMNLARVEQYFAEVLSRIEERRIVAGGGFASQPLLNRLPREEDAEWAAVKLPPNVALVGTVNMDETTHGFSRKVLDRAFTLELSDVDLSRWKEASAENAAAAWPVAAWFPRATSLAGLPPLGSEDTGRVEAVIRRLTEINNFLSGAQLQVGYRTRDETALFVLHAQDVIDSFVDADGAPVDPLDLALQMKVLPRIVGGSGAVRHAVMQLLGWSDGGVPLSTEDDARAVIERWELQGRPGALSGARFPRTAARLCIMWERILAEGYTSFWL
jgi:5-methylcytosine-specific restriction enzyme B